MVRRQKWALSRLAWAWIALGVVLGAGGLSVLLAPVRTAPEEGVVVTLPREPDRYAGSDPTETPPTLAMTPDEIRVPPKPEGKLIDVDGALNEEPSSAEPAADPITTVEEALDAADEGAVVITIPSSSSSAPQLVRPPQAAQQALQLSTPQGVRPARGPAGLRPFDAYRRVEAPAPGAKSVALMVSGLGLDPAVTERAITVLPPSVSLSFAPYTKDLSSWVDRAVAKGHEVIIEVPMEARGVGPGALGPAALMTDRSAEANAKRLEWILSRTPAYPMVTNYLGATFVADEAAMVPVLTTLREAGLAYIDDTGSGADLAVEAGVPHAAGAFVLPPGSEDAMGALDELAKAAVPGSPPLAKVYAGGGGLEAALAWAETATARGVEVVPASAAVEGAQ